MTRDSNQSNRNLRIQFGNQPRKGGAFLLLVVAVLVVIVAATQAMLKSEIRSQQNERERVKTNALVRAMKLAQAIEHDWEIELKLPIDQANSADQPSQFIQISAGADKTKLTASWMVDGKAVASVVRPRTASDTNASDEPAADIKPDPSESKPEK